MNKIMNFNINEMEIANCFDYESSSQISNCLVLNSQTHNSHSYNSQACILESHIIFVLVSF